MQKSLANQIKVGMPGSSTRNSTSYGSRTRDLRLERAASLATRRTRHTFRSQVGLYSIAGALSSKNPFGYFHLGIYDTIDQI